VPALLITISGPEKAGKTTLINGLAPLLEKSEVRHWSGPANDPRNTRFLPALREDYAASFAGASVIWDRSWLCHNVYGFLLNHPHNETVRNPLLSEWLYGRAVAHLGFRVVLLPQDWREAQKRRTADDLEVHARFECQMYRDLATEYGHLILENDYTEETLGRNLAKLYARVHALENHNRSHRLEELVSPPQARVCFVAEKPEGPNDAKLGEWLPFSHREGWKFAQMIGTDALQCGWAYSHRLPPSHLRAFDTLVTFGELPYIWCKQYVGHKKVIALPKLPHVVSARYAEDWPETLRMIRGLLTPAGDEEVRRKEA
jgi:hypothetical protein